MIFFYGFVTTEATHYVLVAKDALDWIPNIWVCLGIGCVTNTLLLINNYRDYSEDKKHKKNTLVVIFGRKFGVYFHLACIVISGAICPFFEPKLLLLCVVFLLGLYCNFKMRTAVSKADFDKLLTFSVCNLALYGVFACFSLFYSQG